jgi:large subunit ribosomal protein L21
MAQETKKKTTTTKKTATKKSTAKKTTTKKSSKKIDFAVIEISGTQLRVKEGDRYEIEKIKGEKGDKVEVKEVLMISQDGEIKVGKPYLKDMKVTLNIDSQLKGEKIEGFKYKAKSRYRKRYGYRPQLSRVTVKKIG